MTKVAKYLKNVRGTICGSQVVENPETVRPNPAQTMYEVQPSRLLPIQISTFDCREQAMMNIQDELRRIADDPKLKHLFKGNETVAN